MDEFIKQLLVGASNETPKDRKIRQPSYLSRLCSDFLGKLAEEEQVMAPISCKLD